MKIKREITQEYIKLLFHYNPENGEFRRIARRKPVPGGTTGELVPCDWLLTKPSKNGYVHTMVEGKYINLHKLIYFYMTGEWPSSGMDHINGDRLDNRWCNLRVVPQSENCRNRGLRYDNKTGTTGVYLDHRGIYVAQIYYNGHYYRLGGFDDLKDAVKARKKAEKEIKLNEHRSTILKAPDLVFRKFVDDRALLKDYNDLILISENMSEAECEIEDLKKALQNAILQIQDKSWVLRTKNKYEKKLMSKLEKFSNE